MSLFLNVTDSFNDTDAGGHGAIERFSDEFTLLSEKLLLDFFCKTQVNLGTFGILYFEAKTPEPFLVAQVYFTHMFNSFPDPQQASFEISTCLPDISALVLQLDKHAECISGSTVFIIKQLMKIIAFLPLNTDEVGRRRLISVVRNHQTRLTNFYRIPYNQTKYPGKSVERLYCSFKTIAFG